MKELVEKVAALYADFFRLYLTVPVEIGTEITMPANAATGKIFQQCEDKHP